MIVIILHLVGGIGSIFPIYSDFFIQLTPLNLLISSIILILSDSNSKKSLLQIFLLTTTVGFFVEVIGVHTGLIFGNYLYGPTLGFKLFDVPLIIGLNWFILTYITHHFVNTIDNNILAAVLASAIMTFTDILIEPVAIMLSYWEWEATRVPMQNYFGWFGVSLILHLIIRHYHKFQSFNKLTIYLFGAQLFYFLMVFLFY